MGAPEGHIQRVDSTTCWKLSVRYTLPCWAPKEPSVIWVWFNFMVNKILTVSMYMCTTDIESVVCLFFHTYRKWDCRPRDEYLKFLVVVQQLRERSRRTHEVFYGSILVAIFPSSAAPTISLWKSWIPTIIKSRNHLTYIFLLLPSCLLTLNLFLL